MLQPSTHIQFLDFYFRKNIQNTKKYWLFWPFFDLWDLGAATSTQNFAKLLNKSCFQWNSASLRTTVQSNFAFEIFPYKNAPAFAYWLTLFFWAREFEFESWVCYGRFLFIVKTSCSNTVILFSAKMANIRSKAVECAPFNSRHWFRRNQRQNWSKLFQTDRISFKTLKFDILRAPPMHIPTEKG
jgi:hypothetical protein